MGKKFNNYLILNFCSLIAIGINSILLTSKLLRLLPIKKPESFCLRKTPVFLIALFTGSALCIARVLLQL